jgi:hypothetical protein
VSFISGREPSLERIRIELATRLRARSAEIEEAILNRVRALSGGVANEDAEYLEGLRAAIAAGVEYGLALIEHEEGWSGPIPAEAATQARRAARYGVSLDTVLRRYAAGDRVLAEFIMDESGRIPDSELRRVLRIQAPQLDRLMASIAAEYTREMERIGRSPQERLAKLVQEVLDGEVVGAEELDYDLDVWHLGAIATGTAAEEAVHTLAAAFARRLLAVPREGGDVWAWLGGRSPVSVADIERRHPVLLPDGVSLALGEPRWGAEGWRLTHHEARAAAQVMARRPARLTKGRDALLLAAILRDEHLARSLLQTYLTPLDEGGGDHGATARRTLRAYLEVSCNAAAAAATLGVDRHTVKRRIDRIEEQLGCLLGECHAELEVALELERLEPRL